MHELKRNVSKLRRLTRPPEVVFGNETVAYSCKVDDSYQKDRTNAVYWVQWSPRISHKKCILLSKPDMSLNLVGAVEMDLANFRKHRNEPLGFKVEEYLDNWASNDVTRRHTSSETELVRWLLWLMLIIAMHVVIVLDISTLLASSNIASGKLLCITYEM